MPIVRVKKENDYTIMANYHFKDKNMTLKAKGLLSQVLELPDNWKFSISGLTRLVRDGKAAVSSALDELKKAGYLVVRQEFKSNGDFNGYSYWFYEKPFMYLENQNTLMNTDSENQNTLMNTDSAFTNSAFTDSGFTDSVKQPQLNTYISSTYISSTKELSIAAASEEIKIDSSTYSPSIYSKTIPSNDLDEIMNRWNNCNNTISISNVIPLSKRWNELQFALVTFGKDKLLEAINRIDSSEWLTSRAQTGNKAKFDTWINIDNIQKLLEGNFENDFSKAKSPESDGYEITL